MDNSIDIKNIVNFVKKYLPYTGDLEAYIQKHIEYGTCFVLYDNLNEIVAVARWNISDDGEEADILDFVIRPDWRKYNKKLMKQMLFRGWWNFPKVKRFSFVRGFKYPKRERKFYDMKKFLNIKEAI